MAYEECTMPQFENNRSRGKPLYAAPSLSPGAAAARLSISRQAVHKAIKADHMTAIRITDNAGTHLATLIPISEIDGYAKTRKNRKKLSA